MKKLFYLIVLFFGFCHVTFSQGTLRGKVADENGETLVGATVVCKNNMTVVTTTDLDGNYSLKIPDSTEQIIAISYVSFATTEFKVILKNNEVVIKDATLKPPTDGKELKEIEIVDKIERDKGYYMENIKKRAATTLDYVSAESMKKTGDNNVTSAVTRVSGVSTNGSFITVRGIGDRYVKTTINGSQIPTLDPFTNNIKLDMIPASLVDNVIITKTASPDLPGDWSAAYISIETKDFPDKLLVNVESQFGYNNQTAFKSILANQVSKTDWLGFDNGFRDKNHSLFVGVIAQPTQYQELVALGLGNFYKELGVTQSWTEGSTVGDNYFKLGLVELGLLDKALFDDPQAVAAAKQDYLNGTYKDQAYEIINAKAAKSGQSFPNNWNTSKRQAPLNFSQNFTIGNQTKLFNRTIGFIAGFRYGNSIQYDANSEANRTILSAVDSSGKPLVDQAIKQQFARYNNGWSALASVAYKYSKNHSLSLLFMPNFTGNNSIRSGIDETYTTPYPYVFTISQFYEQRKQMVYQLKSEHYIPARRIKIDVNASYTRGTSNVPDFKNIVYFAEKNLVYTFDKTLSDVFRNYRYLSENILDSRLAIEIPIGDKPKLPRKFAFGGAYQNIQKKYDQYVYYLKFNQNADVTFLNNDLDAFFSIDKFGIAPMFNPGSTDSYQGIELYYLQFDVPSNHTIGKSNIISGYALLDYAVFPKLRFEGGLRVEHTDLYTDVFLFDSLGYAKNDPRRRPKGEAYLINPGELNQLNFLPSANLIYKLRDNELAPFNLRANYSKTIARPSMREYSETIVRDFELFADVFGNADLKMVEINNYDLRLENYFKSKDNISVSVFYKDFKNHIELVNSNIGFTWTNAEKSRVFGVELEGKKYITKKLEFRANVSFVDSRTKIIEKKLNVTNGVKTWIPYDTVTRKMFGQSPYVVNAILSYSLDSIGFNATVAYNVQGPRLVLTSIDESPDIYELPRHLLDFKVSKTLGKKKHFAVSFTIRDILNSPIRRSYNYKEGFILDFDNYRYGTNYILGISYKI